MAVDTYLKDAVLELATRLKLVFGSAPSKNADLQLSERARHVNGLLAVAGFIERVQMGDDLASHFLTLSSALQDLETGSVHPLLQPAHRSNRTTDPTEVWVGRVAVVNALNCLMMTGKFKTRQEAADFIAKEFPKLSKLCRKNTKLSTSIVNWAKSAESGTIKNKIASGMVRHLSPGFPSSEYRKTALRALKSAASHAEGLLVRSQD